MYDPYNKFTKHVLTNGLEVHSVFWDRPWIKAEIVVHSGGREDPVTIPGLAHFVEHMVSCNIPNRELDQVREFFETCGGRADFGSTGYLSTCYNFSVPADLSTFREAIRIFGSMIFEAQLKKEIEKERKIILREFNKQYPFIEKLEWDMRIRKALFKGHRLETWNRPLGRPEGFLSTTERDLQSFYDRYYTPANISLVIIGGLKTEEVITELEKGSWGIKKDGTRNQIPQTFGLINIPTEQKTIIKLSDHINFKINQTEYKATWAFPSDFHRQSREVFNQILSKILFSEIREKRELAYDISISDTNFHDVHEYEIKGLINPDAIPYIDELIRKCISMIPLRRDLFDREIRSSKQKCLMVDLSGSGLAGNSAIDLIYDQRIIPLQEVWDELQKVTFEQVSEAATLLSSERQYTFITCP